MKHIPLFFLPILFISVSCTPTGIEQEETSTHEDRAALFDYLVKTTSERESFSPVKNETLGLDPIQAMERYREEVVSADTDEALYYALVKTSNARKDRHLSVSLIEGGLNLDKTAGIRRANGPTEVAAHAPVRFAVDFGTPGSFFLFVSDFSSNVAELSGGTSPEVGDKLTAVNGRAIAEYIEAVEPYHRYSTVNGFWWHLAPAIPQKTYQIPPSFYGDELMLELERRDGNTYSITLPYLEPDTIDWTGHGKRTFPGFSQAFSTPTYDLYRSDKGKPVLILAWHGFREHLVEDIDRLMDYAVENELLDHALIFDGTASRGGSKGAYAIQRLSSKPFKTTFGNVRLSDVIPIFIEQKQREFKEKKILDSGVSETIDDGTWLMDWLTNDVSEAIEKGEAYSNNVPFKLAHLPKDSDGIIQPAEVHFRGPMICFFGPHGGSHLDQFASIVIDNELAHTIGMPCGGYSNTWEWEEVLTFPASKKPIVQYMWSIGHTIRPNGEILEGNPAQVDEFIPLTRDNYLEYYPALLSRALEHLGIDE
jgi:hypothetical protein